jgi:hypothetical protein
LNLVAITPRVYWTPNDVGRAYDRGAETVRQYVKRGLLVPDATTLHGQYLFLPETAHAFAATRGWTPAA